MDFDQDDDLEAEKEYRSRFFKLSERNFTDQELTKKYNNTKKINAPIEITNRYGPGSSTILHESIPLEDEVPIQQDGSNSEGEDEEDLFGDEQPDMENDANINGKQPDVDQNDDENSKQSDEEIDDLF